MAIILSSPGGIAPKLRATALPPPYSQKCEGVDLRSGKITPRRGDRFHGKLDGADKPKGFYEHAGKFYPLEFVGNAETVDIISAEDAQATRETRSYITGLGQNLMVRITKANETTSSEPKRVGAPRPDAPTVVISAKASENNEAARAGLPPISATFAVSVLLADGTESQLSAVGSPDEIARAGDKISVSIKTYPLAPDIAAKKWTEGGWDFEGARLLVYMATAPGEFRQVSSGQGYISGQAVSEIGVEFEAPDGDDAEKIITLLGGANNEFQLGQVPGAPLAGRIGAAKENLIAAESGSVPRTGMQGILLHPNRFLVAHTDSLVCFSVPEQFGVWPRAYEIAIPEGEITGIAEHNGAIWVFPKSSPPRVIQIDTPGGGIAATTESRYPVARGGSVVNMGGLGLFYAAADGIVRLPGGELLTAQILDRSVAASSWKPPTIAWAEGDEYVTPDFVLTPRSPHGGFQLAEKTPQARTYVAVCHRNGCGILMDADGGLWDGGQGEPGRLVFRTRRMVFADRSSPARIRVVAGPRQQQTELLMEPTPYGAPIPLAHGSAATPEFVAPPVNAMNSPAQPANFAVERINESSGEVVFRILTGGGDTPEEEQALAFSESRPARQRLRGDVLTRAAIDAQATLPSRRLRTWVEVEIESDGREVEYVAVDDSAGTLQLVPAAAPGTAIIPNMPDGSM